MQKKVRRIPASLLISLFVTQLSDWKQDLKYSQMMYAAKSNNEYNTHGFEYYFYYYQMVLNNDLLKVVFKQPPEIQ